MLSEQLKSSQLALIKNESHSKTIKIELSPNAIAADLQLEDRLKSVVFVLHRRLNQIEWVIGLPDFSPRFVPEGTLFDMAMRLNSELQRRDLNLKPDNNTRNNFNSIIDNFTEIEKLFLQKQEEYQKELIFTLDEVELVSLEGYSGDRCLQPIEGLRASVGSFDCGWAGTLKIALEFE